MPRPDRQPARGRGPGKGDRPWAGRGGRPRSPDGPPTPISHANRGNGARTRSRATLAPMSAHPPADAHPAHCPGPAPAHGQPASRAGPPCTAASARRAWCGSGCAGCRGCPARAGRAGLPGRAVGRRGRRRRRRGGRRRSGRAVATGRRRAGGARRGAGRAGRRRRAAHRPGAPARCAVVDAVADRRGRPAARRDPRRARCPACLVRRGRGADAAARVPPRPCRCGGHAGRRRAHGGRAADPAGAGGGRLPGRRHPARRHPADGLGLGDGVRGRLGRGRRRRTRPPVGRGGPHDPAPLPDDDPAWRDTRDGQAGPTRSATIFADSATIGSPPPGCADPPTRNSPGTGERLAGRSSAASSPCDAVP